MEKKPLIERRSRRFCCCFTSDDYSDDDSSINLPRVESDISPSVLEPAIYTSKKFAAEKIYMLGEKSHKFVVMFKHLIQESDDKPLTSSDNPGNVSDEHWKERFRIFSKFDEGVSICESAWGGEMPEKIAKNLVKNLLARDKIETCVVVNCGVGSLAIQLAKKMNVVAMDSDPEKIECLEINKKVYEVHENLTAIKSTIFEYEYEKKPDLVVISPEIKISKTEAIRLEFHVPNLFELIVKGLEISESVLVVFPPTLDPFDFIDQIENIDCDPCIEFILLFDHSHLKSNACLLGKLTRIPLNDILNIVLSKLGLSAKQKDFISTAIEKISLKRVIQILDEVEKEFTQGSVLEKIKLKSKRFFEIIRQEENVALNNLIFLYKGENGDDIARNLEELNLYFVEIDTVGQSILEINGNRLVGTTSILEYLEDLKIKETPNKNSLFLLIGS